MDASNLEDIDKTYENYAKKINSDSTFNALSYISSHDISLFDRDNLVDGDTALMLVPGVHKFFMEMRLEDQFSMKIVLIKINKREGI